MTRRTSLLAHIVVSHGCLSGGAWSASCPSVRRGALSNSED